MRLEFCQPSSMSHRADPSPRIVVVEDDGSLRAAIERLLRASGYDVLAFGDAETLLATDAAANAACLISCRSGRSPTTAGRITVVACGSGDAPGVTELTFQDLRAP